MLPFRCFKTIQPNWLRSVSTRHLGSLRHVGLSRLRWFRGPNDLDRRHQLSRRDNLLGRMCWNQIEQWKKGHLVVLPDICRGWKLRPSYLRINYVINFCHKPWNKDPVFFSQSMESIRGFFAWLTCDCFGGKFSEIQQKQMGGKWDGTVTMSQTLSTSQTFNGNAYTFLQYPTRLWFQNVSNIFYVHRFSPLPGETIQFD